MLRQTHARMRRHFEGPHFHQTQSAGAALRRVQLVDAEFRPMRIAARVDQQVPEDAIHHPWRHLPKLTHIAIQFLERDLEFIQGIIAGLIDARRLGGRTDEQAAEEAAQRGMILPVSQQGTQQIGPAQHRGVRRRFATDDDVITATRAGMPTVHHELLGAQARLTSLFVQYRRALHQFPPRFAGMEIHLNDPRVRGDGEFIDSGITRRRFAFQDHRQPQFGHGRFNPGDQLEVILGRLHGRHKDMQPPLSGFNTHRRPHDPRRALAGSRATIIGTLRRDCRPSGTGSASTGVLSPLARSVTRRQGRGSRAHKALGPILRPAHQREAPRQGRQFLRRILRGKPRKLPFQHPGQRIQRQTQAHG